MSTQTAPQPKTAGQPERWAAVEGLLTNRSYSPVYRLKNLVFSLLPFVRAIYSFNPFKREQWVKAKAASLAPGLRVLDVGAGTCPYRKYFAHCEYVAHDIGKLEPHQLRTRAGYGELNIVSDITEIPLPSESIDAVLCTEVIEHVPDPTAAVTEMARLLRPGGRLFLTAPLRSGLHQMPYHFYGGYTPSWYEHVLATNGVSGIKISPVCGLLNAFGEESIYVFLYTSPFSSLAFWKKLLLFPFWLLALPFFVALPPICWVLDRLSIGEEFTLGYMVEGTKQ